MSFFSHFGVMPNKRLNAPKQAFGQECAARLFYQGMLGYPMATPNDGSPPPPKPTILVRPLDPDDVVFLAALKSPNFTDEELKEYMETFCFPLIPAESWAKLTLSDMNWDMFNSLIPIEHRYHADSVPWKLAEVVAGEMKGIDWYIMGCCLRFPNEQPRLIEALWEGKNTYNLTLSQCWMYSQFFTHQTSHHFISLPSFGRWSDKNALAKLDLPKVLHEIVEDKFAWEHARLPPNVTRELFLSKQEPNTVLSTRGKWLNNIISAVSMCNRADPRNPEAPVYEREWAMAPTREQFLKQCEEVNNAEDC